VCAAKNTDFESTALLVEQISNPEDVEHAITNAHLSQLLYLLNLLIAGSIRRRRPNRTLFAGGGLAWQ
jgi:hypothetical protein